MKGIGQNLIMKIRLVYLCTSLKNNKYKLRFKPKPWITLSLQKSISAKKQITHKFH